MTKEIDNYYETLGFLHDASGKVLADKKAGVHSQQATIDFSIANPFNTPPQIAVDKGVLAVMHSRGVYNDYANLKTACTGYYKKHGVDGCQENDIHIGTSSLGFIANIFQSGLFHKEPDKRTKVLMPAPTFGYYVGLINPNKDKPEYDIIFNSASKDKDYRVDVDKLVYDINLHKPGVLLLVNPVNPSGQIYTEAELTKIAEACKICNVFVICDEVFADTLPPKNGEEIPSMAKFMPKENVFVTSGIGKAYGLPDARVSWLYGDKNQIDKVLGSDMSGSISCVSAEEAKAILSYDNYSSMLAYREKNAKVFYKNLSLVSDKLAEINKLLYQQYGGDESYIKMLKPETTSVVLLDFSALKGKDFLGSGEVYSGLDIAKALFKKANLATVPGESSMIPPEDMVIRISVADSKDLTRGFARIEDAIKKEKHVFKSATKWATNHPRINTTGINGNEINLRAA